MNKAIKLELSFFEGHIKLMVYPLLATAVFAYFTHSIIYATLMSTIFLSIRIIPLPFEVLNQNESSRHMYNILPLTKKQIVTARYLAIFIVGCFLIIAGIVLQSIILLIFQFSFDAYDVLTAVIVGNSAFLLLQSMQIPFIYQTGVIKGRLYGPSIIIIIFMLVFSFGFKYLREIDFNAKLLSLLFVIVSVVIFFVSRAFSIKIVRSKGL